MKQRYYRTYALIGFSIVAFVFCVSAAWAHWGNGYQYTEYAVAHNPDWMGHKIYTTGGQQDTLYLSDDLHISELSMPGTHDTFSKVKHSWAVHCQMMNLAQQLESGIRVLDVRCNTYDNGLQTAHGAYPDPNDLLNKHTWPWFDTVLSMCVDFLSAHSQETILMRLQRNSNSGHPGHPDTFVWWFDQYINRSYKDGTQYWSDWFWHHDESANPTNPTLGEVRGKIVLLQSFPADSSYGVDGLYGLDYMAAECCACKGVSTNCDSDATIKIQDSYSLGTNWSLSSWKAQAVVTHLQRAAEGNPETIYINYLCGSGGAFPYFVASGHSSPGTGAPHLWMGRCHNCGQLMIRNKIGCCYFWGTNEVAYFHMCANRQRAGIVMADFPGPGLIKILIEINYEQYANWPPIADAGAAYEADEGTQIVFDASNSSDIDGDPLLFRWDFNDDGIWDTEWSDDPTATHTWYDNACEHDPNLYPPTHPDTVGIASLQVKDAEHTSGDAAVVIIYNVNPTVTIDDDYLTPCILPGQPVSFNALISDPGCLDTHTATWSFSDGAVLPGTFTEEITCPDTIGVVSAEHTFDDLGLFSVLLKVQDDDRGSGMDTTFVQVMTALEAIDCVMDFIHNLPEDCFKKPATQRKNTLSNKLTVVKNNIIADNLKGAIEKLRHDIRAKADGSIGGHPNNDWIICEEAQRKLCMTFDGLINYLQSEIDGGDSPGPEQCADADLDDRWLMIISGVEGYDYAIYLGFDGQGSITEIGQLDTPDSAGVYSVNQDCSFSGFIWTGEYMPFDGQIISDCTAAMFGLLGADTIPLLKVRDTRVCEGTWIGSFTQDTTGVIHSVEMEINEQGKIVSCTGFAGPVTGKFLSKSSDVAGYLETGETEPCWREIMVMEASLTRDKSGVSIMSGSFAMSCTSYTDPGGTFSLERDKCFGSAKIKSFKAGKTELGIRLAWDVNSDIEIHGFKIERRLAEDKLSDKIDAVNMIPAGERQYVDGDINFSQSYFYTLIVMGGDDSELASETISVKPKAFGFALNQNHPNPFNPTTTISFELSEKAHAKLSIYDIGGKLIKSLVNGEVDAGLKEVVWEGKDARGNQVSSGIYLYRLTIGNRSLTRKMVLLK